MRNDVEARVRGWDGKDPKCLVDAYETWSDDPAFLPCLVELCEADATQTGATWLIKRNFDTKGPPLSAELTRQHLKLLPKITHWGARLHVLQYLEHLDLPEASGPALSEFVRAARSSDNKFVRAWGFYALAVLAERFPGFHSKAQEQLLAAQASETAGSVKVRIRKALERLKKSQAAIG